MKKISRVTKHARLQRVWYLDHIFLLDAEALNVDALRTSCLPCESVFRATRGRIARVRGASLSADPSFISWALNDPLTGIWHKRRPTGQFVCKLYDAGAPFAGGAKQ